MSDRDRPVFELPEKNGKDRRFTFFMMTILVVLAGMIMSVSAIVHSYGPFAGRVVDAETNQPIAKAEVLIRFYTEQHLQFEDPIPQVADAVETLTDEHGEFQVPSTTVFSFRFFHLWRPQALATIFKPGYGAYPGHPGVSPRFNPPGALPENQPLVIRLPPLKSREERWFNMNVAFMSMEVPAGKGVRFKQMVAEEKRQLHWLPGRKAPEQVGEDWY